MANKHAMNSKQVEELKGNWGVRDTAELLEIWNTNNRKSYTDEAFEAIRLILIERGVAIPQQSVYVPIEEKENYWMPKGIGKKTAGSTMFLAGIVLIILNLIWFPLKANGYWSSDPTRFCYVGVVIGGLLAIIGALLFFFGKSQSEYERTAYPRGYRKKIDGIRLFAIGITGIVMGFLMVFVTMFSMPNMDTPEDMGPILVGFLVFCVAFLMIIFGAILFFVGKYEEKKQREYLQGTSPEQKSIIIMPIVSLVCGIFGILFVFSSIWVGSYSIVLLFGLLAVVLGVISLVRLKRNPSLGGRKTAIAGLALGGILIILGLLAWFHVWRFYW